LDSQKQRHSGKPIDPSSKGPGDRLCQTAAAQGLLPGLEPAAPNLREQVRTGGKSEASGKRRPATRAVRAMTNVGAFAWPVRVFWEDTDAGGIVFYANYLKFFERSRTEWLRSFGIGQQQLRENTGGMFVVAETSVRYLRPARLDDELIVTADLIEIGRASMIIRQQALLKSEHPETVLCEGTVRIGWVNAHTLQAQRIPESILDSLRSKT
jgi:acyl-CoA thioester hydrolase